MPAILLVGLGNCGVEYSNTKHNAGFIALDCIINQLQINQNWRKKYDGLYLIAEIGWWQVIFIKPQTYMNNSGVCVAQFANFYKVDSNNIFVFHDDIDLEVKQIKFKTGGGSGGHNGLKSLDSNIKNGYHRVRFGVGKPTVHNSVANYVLSGFEAGQKEIIEHFSKEIAKNIIFFLEKQFSYVKEVLTKSNFEAL